MTARRGKLVSNGLPCIDYYNDNGHWIARIWESYEGWWSVRLCRVELLSCYHSEEEAFNALALWLDNTLTYC